MDTPIPANADKLYYDDKTRWGENQYITLKNIIDNILITADDDSYFKTAQEHICIIHGKQILKDLNINVLKKQKAIAITVPPTKVFPFPRYMTDWNLISVINKCGELQEINVNNSVLTHDYLQDHKYDLLYDHKGSVLEGHSFAKQKGNCSFKRVCLTVDCKEVQTPCNDVSYENSWVKEVKEGSYFMFSDDLVDKSIVIEFQSASLNNLDACDVKIHHKIEQTITYYIKWKLLEGKRNVPSNEVIYHRSMFKIEKTKSEILLSDKITLSQILDAVELRY